MGPYEASLIEAAKQRRARLNHVPPVVAKPAAIAEPVEVEPTADLIPDNLQVQYRLRTSVFLPGLVNISPVIWGAKPDGIRRPPISMIIRVVAKQYNLRPDDIISDRRTKACVIPRQVACWLAKQMTLASLPHIGRQMGGRDHTTILHAIRRVDLRRQTDREFVDLLYALECEVRRLMEDAA